MGRATGVLARLLIFSTVGSGQLLAGQIYWTDRGYNDPNGPSIRRGEIDGSGSEILLDATDGLSQLRGIALGVVGGWRKGVPYSPGNPGSDRSSKLLRHDTAGNGDSDRPHPEPLVVLHKLETATSSSRG